MLNRLGVLTFAAAALLALPLAAQDADRNTVVATVNGQEITIGHMVAMRDALPAQYKSLPDEVLFDGILEQLVQQSVLSQSVDATTPAVVLQLDNERRASLAGIAVSKIVADAVTDEAISALYDQQFADFAPEPQYNVSHIQVETEQEAADVVARLTDGADFAELAAEVSTSDSASAGGLLGWFSKGQTGSDAFDEAVAGLAVGEVSGPVETQIGWQVIKLNEIGETTPPSLESVRGDLIDELQQTAIEDALASLTASADVEKPDMTGVAPEILRDLNLLEN